MKLTVFLLFGLLLSAQDAEVTVLSDQDSHAVQNAYQYLRDAQADWRRLQDDIRKKYGLTGEIEFSKDFRAVVPKKTEIKTYGSGWYNLYSYTIPSLGWSEK